MANNGLAEAFTRLSTSDSRLNALEALIRELTPYEWRFVQSLTKTRTFQFDIIGRLPVELVSQIFSYLDASTPWRLQLVSRSWFEKLRSLLVLKSTLDSWYNSSVNFQGADINFCRRKARSVHAFRSPSQSALPDNSIKILTRLGRTQILVGDNLIWLDPDCRQVRILNMRSWTPEVLNGVAREMFRNVYASDEIVVFPTTGHTVYVASLNSPGPLRRFLVVNPRASRAITCQGRTVAYAGYLQDSMLVYIWDFDSQQGRSFNISYEHLLLSGRQLDLVKDEHAEIGLLLQPDTKTIVVCIFDRSRTTDSSQESPTGPRIVYGRFTYAGECLYSAEHALDGYDQNVAARLTPSDGRGLRFVRTSHDGLFRLQGDAWRVADRSKAVPPLQFDENLHAFTSPVCPGPNSPSLHQKDLIVWWKDVFVEAGIKENTVIHRGSTSSPRYEPLLAYDGSKGTPGEEGYATDLLVNDRYIVRPYRDAFYIYCYDHTVQFPAKEGTLDGVGPWEVIESDLARTSEYQ